MFKDKSKLLWTWRLQCMPVLLWIPWTSSFQTLAAVTMKSIRFIMHTIPYYYSCRDISLWWGLEWEGLYFLLENLRKERNILSCINTVTEWGKSITESFSVGPKFACVGIPVWEQRWSLRVNTSNFTVKMNFIVLVWWSEPLNNREKVVKSTIK